MPNKPLPIEDVLEASGPRQLSSAERESVWNAVLLFAERAPTPSPYVFNFTQSSMIPLIVAVVVLLSAGGTVAASDSARPGDLLFPIDRAIEDVHLSLASEKDKADLRVKFADERLHEFDSILDDELGGEDLSGILTEAEADIFTDITIVKLEAGDRKAVFSTEADTHAEIIAEIIDRYGFTEAEVEAVLSVETEDRASRAEDGGEVSEDAKLRIEHALAILNVALVNARGSADEELENAIDVIEDRLLERSDLLPEEIRVKVRDDRSRVEVRSEDGSRVRVETKDGETRIKVDDSDDSEDSSALEIEADIFTDVTIVTVEKDDRKTSFETDADTRAEVIAEVLRRHPELTNAEVEATLDLEIEDRASRSDDREDSDDEDAGDDHSGSGHDDEEDNSGSGSSGHGGNGD
jgi:hypothetical protein